VIQYVQIYVMMKSTTEYFSFKKIWAHVSINQTFMKYNNLSQLLIKSNVKYFANYL